MNRDPTVCRSFVRQAKDALSEHPQIKHEWSIDADEDHCVLIIPETSKEGFTIVVETWPDEIIVGAGGAHMNLCMNKDNPEELSIHALGLVRDLLSPIMRVREWQSGGRPHKWAFEILHEGDWITEETVGLFFFNYFGKKSENIYQNRALPPREDPVEIQEEIE